jgi:hypothetical protein
MSIFKAPVGATSPVTTSSIETDPLDGISQTDCPYDCNAERCCIVGAPICSHPNKGGLQAKFLSDPAILRCFNDARQRLAQTKLAQKDEAFLNGDTNV